MLDLPLIWAGIIAFAVLAYILLDGFDLGVGILFSLLSSEADRDLAMDSIAPVWDGNETWLIMGGGGLFAVFPLAYATILPALYAPIVAMLLGLIFRGVAFEFRARSNHYRSLWDVGFTAGSVVAAFAQGIALGALVQGIEVADRGYAGGWFDWLTPFSVLTGLALVVGYALLGATWLNMKTEGALRECARNWSVRAGLLTLSLIGLVSLSTPFLDPTYAQRWFTWPGSLFSVLVPTLLLLCVWAFWRGLQSNRDTLPFVAAQSIFVLCYVGILISFFPYLVPPSIDLWQAAAPDKSLEFLLVGTLVLLPIILTYTGYAYWVFRGKVRPGEGYH